MSGSGAKPLSLRSSQAAVRHCPACIGQGMRRVEVWGIRQLMACQPCNGTGFVRVADRSASEDRIEQSEAHHETD